jgi:tetratricopeptide (TPR) repeat protein
VNKNILMLLAFGVALFIILWMAPSKPPATAAKPMQQAAPVENITLAQILTEVKKSIPPYQAAFLDAEQAKVTNSTTKADSLLYNRVLLQYCKDSLRNFILGSYYLKNVALLENSEKNLTFAAQLILDSMMISGQPAIQNWLANSAKELFERSIQLNGSNDSSKIGLAACYIFGNVANNPMLGILPLKEIVQKNPDNVYAQMILGLGGRKSGQYDKAIERFNIILTKHPDNLEAIVNLAECYELKGDKPNAIKWYEMFKSKISNPAIISEVDNRIESLNK